MSAVYEPVSKDLRAVEECLKWVFSSSSDPVIVEMGNFLMSSPGKRIRPSLMLLMCESVSRQSGKPVDTQEIVSIAAAVEMIHAASLIHDDMVDGADLRHNRPSVNSKWGDHISVLFGDYVYSKAFELIAGNAGNNVFRCFCEAIRQMCEGELTQVLSRDQLDMSRETYMSIVERKTASLFGACCEVGAIAGGGSVEVRKMAREYGINIGIAYQIADDYRDLAEDREGLGKLPGRDMMIGEVTLPVINLLDCMERSESESLRKMLESGVDDSELADVRELFLGSCAAAETRQAVCDYAERGKKNLSVIQESEYRKSLEGFADYIINKTLVNCVR